MRRFFIVLFLLFYFFTPPTPIQAESSTPAPYTVYIPLVSTAHLPTPSSNPLELFVSQVANGDSTTIRGVYADGVMAYRVLQQPVDNSNYVTLEPDAVTQFSLAARLGVTGLLAHNILAGKSFNDLQLGQNVTLIYGDGRLKTYRITSITGYEVIDPQDPTTDYRNTQTDEAIDLSSLFSIYYMGEHHLTLQTCLEYNGDPSWGRLFIVAVPIS
jgi:hypothetical protein